MRSLAYLRANMHRPLHRALDASRVYLSYAPRRGSGFSVSLSGQNNAKETTGWRARARACNALTRAHRQKVLFGARACVCTACTRCALRDVWRARDSNRLQNRVKSKRPHAEAAIRKQNSPLPPPTPRPAPQKKEAKRRNKKRDAKSIARGQGKYRRSLCRCIRRRDAFCVFTHGRGREGEGGDIDGERRVIDLFVYLGRRPDAAKRIRRVSFGICSAWKCPTFRRERGKNRAVRDYK